jgi:membrane protease YdiL (CAAX protease family)
MNNNMELHEPIPYSIKKVNWKRVGIFLAVTFAATWLLDLAIYLRGGLTSPVVSLALQLQMLIPAAAAILLGLFFFKDSPLYYSTNRTLSRWFVYFYLLVALLYAVCTIIAFIQPALTATLSQSLLLASVVGLILLIVLRIVGKYDAFASINMAGGKWWMWLVFGLGVVAFYGSQAALNWLFKLGTPVDLYKTFPQLQYQTLPLYVVMISMVANSIVIGPFLGLIIAFGEEYGWRGYLQPALLPLGKVKGVLLLGVIWGIWHWPVIWMGYNYPNHPILGSLLMVLFTIVLAFVLAYAVFKGKGIWIAAFLHALNNQAASFFQIAVYAVKDPVWAFGMGIFGFLCGALIILLILRDPIWKD